MDLSKSQQLQSMYNFHLFVILMIIDEIIVWAFNTLSHLLLILTHFICCLKKRFNRKPI